MDQKEGRDDVTLWVRIYACDLLGVEKTLKFGQHFTTELSSMQGESAYLPKIAPRGGHNFDPLLLSCGEFEK